MIADNITVSSARSEAFSEVYIKYYSKLYKYTVYRVGDPNVAEDLVSEVFEKVLVKYHTYNSEKGMFSTWLFTIASNTIINYHKRNGSKTEPINLEKVEYKSQLEDLIIDRELKELLLKAIMYLEEHQRNIIAFKFGACLTNRQIARMMRLTESNVGTILYRSLKKLRDILKEQGVVY
ncbi:RNA polymerase sigma factor [Desulfosporosinus lacus]|uniref:RNA polymerase sigma-70 factor, ECF subfamily n=1 Tax=Desulfosporosinus lacus DSM 15449 TaxID=1121420 RepID=A0A1M5QWU6_9FIRM|nr:sigma-70 family RNA polymerase sigma factor [Desulfosporosinus lacus]SHH18220.1 RNA polymerase sigma-70 factor, ECF subfamily [Desulfosporosinus lacus DSM 15449]